MAYTVQVVTTAAELALAIAAIPEWIELVEVAEVEGNFWLITEPDDDDIMPSCCCDCHNDNTEAAQPSMAMSINPDDLIKTIADTFSQAQKLLRK